MVNVREVVLPRAKYGVKCPTEMNAQYITVHNTANDATAANEIKYMQGNDKEISFHVAVDDKEAIIGVPLNRHAWHCG